MRYDLWSAILLIAAGAMLLVPGTVLCETQPVVRPNAIGLVIGVPQTVAVTYGRALTPRVQLSIYAGSFVLFSSAGARVQIGSWKRGLRPYGFAGVALIQSTAEDYGDPTGLSGYFWLGPGLGLCARRWTLFAEICALLGGNPDRGLGTGTWIFPFAPAISGGILFRF
jgi:hypothetical protein